MPTNEPAVKISQFLGLRNKDRPARLPMGSLVVAQNVDIDDTGAVQRRRGFTASAAFTSVTAAYATRDESQLFVVDNGSLKRVVSPSPLVTELLATGIPDGEIYWCEAGNLIFYSGAAQGVIDGSRHLPIGIPMAPAPYLHRCDGTLPAGRYQIACVYQDAYGRQGGAGPAAAIELDEPGGIALNLQTLSGYTSIIYASEINGGALLRVDSTTAAGYQITAPLRAGFPLDEAQIATYPAPGYGEQIAFFESRIWVAEYAPQHDQTLIFFSKPFFYHLFDLGTDYLAIPGRVHVLTDAGGALLIGTDREIHLYAGDVLSTVAPYGVIAGQSVDHDESGAAIFWTARGLCKAAPFQNLTDEVVSVPAGTRAAVSIARERGNRHAVVVVTGADAADNAYV